MGNLCPKFGNILLEEKHVPQKDAAVTDPPPPSSTPVQFDTEPVVEPVVEPVAHVTPECKDYVRFDNTKNENYIELKLEGEDVSQYVYIIENVVCADDKLP